jgi:predicted nucleotide-binding protein
MKSSFVRSELLAMAGKEPGSDTLIIPVIIEHVPELPQELATRQWIDLSALHTPPTPDEVDLAGQRIVYAVETFPSRRVRRARVSARTAADAAEEIAEEFRRAERAPTESVRAPNSVFLVHGHDGTTLKQVPRYLVALGVTPVILKESGGAEQSLFRKFERHALEAKFAIALMSADDSGASIEDYEDPAGGDRALQFRARQNVPFELGFFYGRLGWEKVLVLYRRPERRSRGSSALRTSTASSTTRSMQKESGVTHWQAGSRKPASSSGNRRSDSNAAMAR